jgi:hypothetical protein
MSSDKETFTCDYCGETFPKEWTDEEAWAEAHGAFSEDELEDAAVVCDDCWKLMRRFMPELDERYFGG